MKRQLSPTVLVALIATLAGQSSLAAKAESADALQVGPVKKLHGGLKFTEGPTADAAGNVYFTDIPANRIYKSDPTGKLSVFLEPSGHANGLMLRGDDELLACQMDGQLVSIDLKTKKVTPLASKHQGKRFNACNDLVCDSAGGVYITDPRFRAPQPWPQGKEAFYYVAKDGAVTRLGDDLAAPNGIILSPDEKTLYVIPSMSKKMMAYPVEAPGKLGKGRVFCELKQARPGGNGGGDGLTIDTQGRLYITSGLGVQVFSPQGKLLKVIEFPEKPANVTFAGKDRKTLFVTARTSVYTAETNAQGHVFPGK